MSNQKFTATDREAFHRAHNGKCAYTRQLLDMSSFHIDHILPESLADDPAALAEAKSKLDLDEAFSIYGYENLLPAAPGAKPSIKPLPHHLHCTEGRELQTFAGRANYA